MQKLYKVSAEVNFVTVPLAEATHGEFQTQCGKKMPMSVDMETRNIGNIHAISLPHMARA